MTPKLMPVVMHWDSKATLGIHQPSLRPDTTYTSGKKASLKSRASVRKTLAQLKPESQIETALFCTNAVCMPNVCLN